MRVVEALLKYKDKPYYVKAGLIYCFVDNSFSHEFGVEESGDWELVDLDIIECYTGTESFSPNPEVAPGRNFFEVPVNVDDVPGFREFLIVYFGD